MAFHSIINTLLLVIVTVGGLYAGYYVIEDWFDQGAGSGESRSPDDNKQQLSVNLGILYATIILVIGSIVSEWPPEGQSFPEPIEELVFFVSVGITALIVGRVTKLIVKLESRFP